MSPSSTDASLGRRLGAGAAAGVVAYLLGYLVTYLVAADPIRASLATQLLDLLTGESPVWKLVGWAFYGSHFVDAVVPGLLGGSNTVNLVATDPITDALYVVPPLLLLAAGALAATAADAADPVGGAKAGAFVVVGYLPLAVVGVFLFTLTVGDASAAPDLPAAVLVAGLVYPAVFGTGGGAVRGAV